MRHLLLCVVLLLSGCGFETGLEPSEVVIAKSSERDFGFSGTWTMSHTGEDHDEGFQFTGVFIEKGAHYKATAIDTEEPELDLPPIVFRAEEISDQWPHAILEFEYEGIFFDGMQRRLAIANVDGNRLHIWKIDRRKLGKLLFDNKTPAVIEHSNSSSTVRCDSAELLGVLKQHAAELMQPLCTLKRKPEVGE